MNDPILTVTLNPALDVSARISKLVAGPKLRLHAPMREAGGGGVNVARVIHELGGSVCAWLALGGAVGAQHLALLRAQGVATHVFDAPGETRQSWAITDETAQQFRLQMPGDDWPAALGARALDDIVAQARGLVVLSGSQPNGVSDSFPQDLARRLGEGRLIVDTSGAPLQRLIARPDLPAFVLRLDQAEAELQAGCSLATPQETARFAQDMRKRNVADLVAIACGADGNVLASQAGLFHCRPPQVPVRSKVGAGDSFTGAFSLALARGDTAAQALVLGTAAAAATVTSDGTALCKRADVEQLAQNCQLLRLDA